jgi:hypothetical protein
MNDNAASSTSPVVLLNLARAIRRYGATRPRATQSEVAEAFKLRHLSLPDRVALARALVPEMQVEDR